MKTQFNRSEKPNFPLSAWLKGIPGLVGIHLEKSPSYECVLTNNGVEVRNYAPMTLAQVTLSGPFERFRDTAFDLLASYVFGKNSTALEMEMTTPIFFDRFENHWTMSFVIPASVDVPPKPIDDRIRIVKRPKTTVVSLAYHGNNTLEQMEKYATELKTKVASWPKPPAYSLQFVQYDGPATVPILKKNEVHLILEDE